MFQRMTTVGPVALALAVAACAGRPGAVSPAEIPELQERIAAEPGNGEIVLRLAAALFSASRCDTAVTVARTGMALRAGDALGPLVVGQCQEQANQYAAALNTYDQFLAAHPDARGSSAIRARRMLAERSRATQVAREALARESELSQTTADPTVVAVLPLVIVGDSVYQPLSRGLAQILTSDLALLERFRMVERLQLGALLEEMQLGQTARFDPATTARVGQLIQAGRLVQGLTQIPDEDNVRLEASVVLSNGQVTNPASAMGRLRDLMQMEKELVVGIAAQMGYQLSEAERRAILENGTQNLAAFLAYSRGLVAEDLGDFSAAAAYFGQAAQADPGFQAARTSYQAAQAAPAVQQASAGQVTQVAQQPPEPPAGPAEPVSDALTAVVQELAPTQSEATSANTQSQTTNQSQSNATANPPPPPTTPPTTVTGTIRIIFRLP